MAATWPGSQEGRRTIVSLYSAVGLVPTVRGIKKHADIQRHLHHLADLMAAAHWLSSLDLPVKLVAIPEGALQGFTDEVFDLNHEQYAQERAIDIPGEETAFLGELAKHWDVYLMAQAKARHPEFPRRFFNVGFIVDPNGEVIVRHYNVTPLFPVEHSVTPFDVFDRWIELYGYSLESLYPRPSAGSGS